MARINITQYLLMAVVVFTFFLLRSMKFVLIVLSLHFPQAGSRLSVAAL